MKKLLLILLLPLLAGCTIDLPGNTPLPVAPPPAPPELVNQRPVALYSISHRVPYVGQPVTFDGTHSRDEDGWIVAWRWNLGFAGIQTGSIVTVTYEEAGECAILLTVTDNDGGTDSIYNRLEVGPPSKCGTGPGSGCPSG